MTTAQNPSSRAGHWAFSIIGGVISGGILGGAAILAVKAFVKWVGK